MTEQQQTEQQGPTSSDLVLVQTAMQKVASGKLTLADLLATNGNVAVPSGKDLTPPTVPALSDEEREAIALLPEVFNSVEVTTVRKLTEEEQAKIVEERRVLNLVEKAIKPRKEKAIRETIANHLDLLVPKPERDALPKDAHGHVGKRQDVPVPGTGMKMQRSVSGGKPNLNITHIEMLHREGKIDRKTYLAVTKVPDTPRVLDEAGLHKAIQKDPALFFLLAGVAEPTTPTTTIKVVPNS